MTKGVLSFERLSEDGPFIYFIRVICSDKKYVLERQVDLVLNPSPDTY